MYGAKKRLQSIFKILEIELYFDLVIILYSQTGLI